MTRAADLSNWSGEITPQQAHDLYEEGVRRVIVQVVNERILTHRQQIPVLIDAGLEVQAYVYVWFSGGEQFVKDRVRWACSELGAFPRVEMVWLDCEQSTEDDPPFDYINLPTTVIIRSAVDVVARSGYRPGIYTRRDWWELGTNNSTAFKDLPLWNANYDGDPDLDPAGYGGWGIPHMEQYQGTSTLAGVPMVDLNSYDGPQPLPNGEFLPEPELPPLDLGVVAGLWQWVINPGARNDFDVTPIPAPRGDGWSAWTVQRRKS